MENPDDIQPLDEILAAQPEGVPSSPTTLEEMEWLYRQMKVALSQSTDPQDRVALLSAMTDLAVGLAQAEAAKEMARTFVLEDSPELPPFWSRGGDA